MSLIVPLVLLWASGELLRRAAGTAGARGVAGWLDSVPESFGLGAALGYLVFLSGVWFRPFALSWLALPPLLTGALFLWRRSRDGAASEPAAGRASWKPAEIVTASAVAILLAAALGLLFATPLLDWDARILWALKAKILASERTLITETFRDPYRLHIHPRYPLLLPWLASLPSGVAGEFRESHFQAVAALLAVLGTVQLFRLGRESGSRQGALLGALLLVLTAGWLRNVLAAGVELGLMLFLLLSVQALWRWLERRSGGDLILAAVHLFGCASVKNEGLLLALSLIGGLGLVVVRRGGPRGRDLAAVLGLLALWTLLMAFWWRHAHFIPPVSDENYPARLRPEFVIAGLQRLPLLLRELARHALDLGTWHLVWPGLPLLGLWAWRKGALRNPGTLLLFIVLFLYGGGVLGIYVLSPWRDLSQHIAVSFDRVLLPLLPLAILLLERTLAARGRS